MAALTENQIINNAFYLLEKDSDPWATTDDEYSTARGFLNMGVVRWEHYLNTPWRELWIMNSSALSSLGGDTTVSASTWTYDAPSDFIRPGGYVTTTASDGGVTWWRVVPVEKANDYANSTDKVCWFTGNNNLGVDLKFNPNTTLTTGSSIDYPYYKRALQSSAASTVLELGDPNFLSYFIAAHMSESSESVEGNYFSISERLLDQMRTVNNSGIWSIPFNVNNSLEDWDGFGVGESGYATSLNPTNR